MYLVASKLISPQPTFESDSAGEIRLIDEQRYLALEPDYLDEIPASALRRMGKTVKMGVASAMPLLRQYPVDAIIIGTATGGLEDCVKFLNQIVDYDEGMLTPTNFVASTPNGLAGQLAILTENHGYNCTHTNSGLAFENALLDALMMHELGESKFTLVGAVEEISTYNVNIDQLAGCFKTEPVPAGKLLEYISPGSVCGEGAAMFIVSETKTTQSIRIVDVLTLNSSDESILRETLARIIRKNGLQASDVDVLISGKNGDSRFQHYYSAVEKTLTHAGLLAYKHLSGEYRTSSSFALWLAMNYLNGNEVNPAYVLKSGPAKKTALIYTNFMGNQHSFILVSAE